VLFEASVVLKPGGGAIYVWSAGKPPAEQIEPVPACLTQMVGGRNGSEIHDVRELFGGSLFACGLETFGGFVVAADHPKQVFEWERPSEPVTLAGGVEGFGGEFKVFFGGGQECEVKVNGANSLECAAVPGPNVSVAGKSRDGSYVYGFSSAVLTAAANGRGEKAVAGASSLYMRHYDGAEWEAARFIASGQFGRPGSTLEPEVQGLL
jgi:hypothetical protein